MSSGIISGMFDSVFDFIDDLVELVFAKVRQLTLWRKSMEWLDENLAIAHEVKQFDILVSGADPYLVVTDLIKVVKPMMQSDPQVFVGGIEKRSRNYLLANETVLDVLG